MLTCSLECRIRSRWPPLGSGSHSHYTTGIMGTVQMIHVHIVYRLIDAHMSLDVDIWMDILHEFMYYRLNYRHYLVLYFVRMLKYNNTGKSVVNE